MGQCGWVGQYNSVGCCHNYRDATFKSISLLPLPVSLPLPLPLPLPPTVVFSYSLFTPHFVTLLNVSSLTHPTHTHTLTCTHTHTHVHTHTHTTHHTHPHTYTHKHRYMHTYTHCSVGCVQCVCVGVVRVRSTTPIRLCCAVLCGHCVSSSEQ